MQSPRHLEGIAQEVHDELGVAPPVDLAEALGFEIRWWTRGYGAMRDGTIWLPARARPVRVARIAAHELGHFLLRRAGQDDRDEEAAEYVGLALLLPRRPFEIARDASGWDLFDLQARFPHAALSALAERLVHLSPAYASVWDEAGLTRRVASVAGLEDLDVDRELVARVLEHGRPERGEDGDAWPAFDGRYRRVVVVRRAA